MCWKCFPVYLYSKYLFQTFLLGQWTLISDIISYQVKNTRESSLKYMLHNSTSIWILFKVGRNFIPAPMKLSYLKGDQKKNHSIFLIVKSILWSWQGLISSPFNITLPWATELMIKGWEGELLRGYRVWCPRSQSQNKHHDQGLGTSPKHMT